MDNKRAEKINLRSRRGVTNHHGGDKPPPWGGAPLNGEKEGEELRRRFRVLMF